MIWIYLLLAIGFAVGAALFFMAALYGDEDRDAAMFAALAFVAAWLWPLVIPGAIVVLIVFIFMHIFIMFKWMKEPEWWPGY